MKITTQKQVNVLVWSIALMLWGCLLIDFLTDFEIVSAITGLVLIGSLCLFYVVHRSEPGQQVFSHLPQKLLPKNKFLRWSVLLAAGMVTVGWILDIGEFLLAG
ncbi:hypothetical protein F4Z99_20680 [Candidatus Poribacteria bacterium]|nr:hypothetical protein [Candidatus Poribacteria bacterium]MYB01306.1 hypothetical protein [Candidatus Poribacteria bacterium]